MSKLNNTVYAEWEVSDEDMQGLEDSDFHISQGRDQSDQGLGYFSTDTGAVFTKTKHPNLRLNIWNVKLECPSQGIEKFPDYWLSPNQIDGWDTESYGVKFGIVNDEFSSEQGRVLVHLVHVVGTLGKASGIWNWYSDEGLANIVYENEQRELEGREDINLIRFSMWVSRYDRATEEVSAFWDTLEYESA